MRRFLVPIAAFLLAAQMATPAFGASLEKASIRSGEEFEISPFSFYASYSNDVTLAGATLVDQDRQVTAIPVGVVTRSKLVAFDLPVLVPHTYRLAWRVREAPGGPERTHQVSFVIRGCKTPQGQARGS
jgi:hypothetical protein